MTTILADTQEAASSVSGSGGGGDNDEEAADQAAQKSPSPPQTWRKLGLRSGVVSTSASEMGPSKAQQPHLGDEFDLAAADARAGSRSFGRLCAAHKTARLYF